MANILVIDDDEQLRELLTTLLTSAGHVVTTAGNGQEGVERFRAEPADLVITDIVMPDQEGIETIIKLRSEYPDLGIIAMSGGASHSATWLSIAAKLGASRTLAKPFPIAQLTEAVTAVLAARPPPSRKIP
jgi:CheY-like chemotaxis protein